MFRRHFLFSIYSSRFWKQFSVAKFPSLNIYFTISFFFKIHFLWASRYPKWISLDKERIKNRIWWLGTLSYCLYFLALSLLLLSMSCFVELENLLILLLHANLPWSFPPAFYNNITHQPQSHFNQLVTEMCYYIVCIGNGGKYCIMLSNDILQLLVNPFIQE